MKYFVLWEWDMSKMPAEQSERMAVMQRIMGMVTQHFKDHPGEEWGGFPGENRGYWLGAASWQDIARMNQVFAPYFKMQVHQAMNLNEFGGFISSLIPAK